MKVIQFVVVFLVLRYQRSSADDNVYGVSNDDYGRQFDGIGSISGGGATSRLLVNYPEKQRNEILDFLFKPNFGASLHIFKVEIGGDAQSSDGGEASHMHERWDENYQRGYEWWLMTEAKKRNPDILLYGLPWAFPAWVGNGTYNAFADPEVTADYVIRWITAAQTYYNLNLDFIGIWNERNYSSTYIKILRKMMDSRGLEHIRICAPDQHGWDIAENLVTDAQLEAAVDFIGTHYPASLSDQAAVNIGKQLWASEDHGFAGLASSPQGACRARMLNLNYVNGLMTATISWNLISSYYVGLPHSGSGLMTALEPWSGHYTVDAAIWVSAHTTQFTSPGWHYLPHGRGVGKLTRGGSYVSLTDTSTGDLTIVIETMSFHPEESTDCIQSPFASGPQNASFKFSGVFTRIESLQVWYTKLGFNGNDSIYFQQIAPIQVVNDTVTLSLCVDEIYTLTTVSSGQKGTATNPPPSKPFPLPYKEDFEEYRPHDEPNNLAQQVGVWEITEVGAPHGQVARQMVLQHPVYWCWGRGGHPDNNTVNVIGNFNWTDIYVEVEARVGAVNGTDGVFVAARIDRGGCVASKALGIFFIVFPKEQRYELTNDLARHKVLKSGLASTNTDWNTISLLVQNDVAVGTLNGDQLFNASIPAQPSNGFVGLGTIPYGLADFDNLFISNSSDGLHRIQMNDSRDKTLHFEPGLVD
ncbi:galactocerebrosidase-like [Liolophura sinensis]|uniref:galactocerebrosidase-like n=1 Tax=Liolophura sinensis TaxID=3198878 RepID=UPI0031583634